MGRGYWCSKTLCVDLPVNHHFLLLFTFRLRAVRATLDLLVRLVVLLRHLFSSRYLYMADAPWDAQAFPYRYSCRAARHVSLPPLNADTHGGGGGHLWLQHHHLASKLAQHLWGQFLSCI